MTLLASRPAAPTVPAPASTSSRTTPQTHGRRGFRRDIQGLRAIAVLLVVLYHCNVPGLNAGYVGVDVFFVISGFLITGQILREIERTGRLRLVAFYARRMRRLLPSALLVVVVTVVVARFWGPVLQIKSTARDAIWTAAYAMNFHLAAEGVNYQQANGPVSPLQHFWSLAVEEQFYLVWPLLILVAGYLGRGFFRAGIGVVILGVTIASLYWSMVVTGRSAPVAYFSVQTRAWEFGFGALIAVIAGSLAELPRFLAGVMTWLGLVLVVGSAVFMNDATPFPGYAALIPVIGASWIIIGGSRSGPGMADRLLAARPMQLIGRFSYGWYLWHWPMLVLAPAIVGYELNWERKLEVAVLALWVAGLSYVMLEHLMSRRPLRVRWVIRGTALSGICVAACVAVLVSAPAIAGTGRYAQPLDLSSPASEALASALVVAQQTNLVPANLTPTLEHAANDVPVTESGCHLAFTQVRQGTCAYGDTSSTKTAVLFGDSHAQQWDGALIKEAQTQHWRLLSLTKAACPAAEIVIVNPQLKRRYTECEQWREATLKRIAALHPSVVFVSQSDSVVGKAVSSQTWMLDTVRTLDRLRSSADKVVFIGDTPYPKTDMPTCVAAHTKQVEQCGVSRPDAYSQSAFYAQRHALVQAGVRSAGFASIEPASWLCSSRFCPAIVGNELIYRDDSHITNTFSTTLAPLFETLLPR